MAMGGNSLQITQVVAYVNAIFRLSLSIEEGFQYPTIASLARRIEALKANPSEGFPKIVDLNFFISPLEIVLIGLWAEILDFPDAGLDTDFFTSGGNPASAKELRSCIERILQLQIQPNQLLDCPTPRQLAREIQNRLGESAPFVEPLPRNRGLPLSFSQENMWLAYQVDRQNLAYNVGGIKRLLGPLNPLLLKKSLETVVQQHDSLRMIFPVENGQPVQKILPEIPDVFKWIDLSALPASCREEQALSMAKACLHQSFDLEKGPLIAYHLIQMSDEEHILAMNMHHILADGWGLALFDHQISVAYNAALAGEALVFCPPPLQLPEYCAWQRTHLAGAYYQELAAYWLETLEGATAVELPTSFPRPAVRRNQGRLWIQPIPDRLYQSITTLGARTNCTPFMVFLAAFYTLLYRYTGLVDETIAVPIANRNQIAAQELIACLINTLLVRVQLSPGDSVQALLQEVRRVSLAAFDHQDMPYTRLITEMHRRNASNRVIHPKIMLNMINIPLKPAKLAGVSDEAVELDDMGAQFDLTLHLYEEQGIWKMSFEYDTDLFDQATIARMASHYLRLLEGMCSNPAAPLSLLPMLGSDERGRQDAWNQTSSRTGEPQNLLYFLERQVAATPDAPAFFFEEQTLTFQELALRSNRLARYLQVRGAVPGTVIGICMRRSLELVVGLIGILKAGGVYLPLDPAYPPDRLAFMLSDSGAQIVLGAPEDLARVPYAAGTAIDLDRVADQIALESDADLPIPIGPESPLYIIYTSGSSGQPKGVIGSHRATLNRLGWMWRVFPFQPGEVACQKTALSFVDSVWELFGPLLRGIPAVILPDEVTRDPHLLLDELARREVTRVVLVPSLLHALLDTQPNLARKLPRLWLWVSSGEALPVGLVQRFRETLPEAVLLNLYGSSEVSADVTWYDTRHLPGSLQTVPIGRPMDNTQVYILDAEGRPLPIGVTGEIYVGGDSLSLGYHNRPELNALQFVPDPFSSTPGGRLYRTGDLGRFLESGDILYEGRADRQVKIRGVRIELDEVEMVLGRHPGLANCALVVHTQFPTGPALVAFLVGKNGERTPAHDLRSFLRTQLPDAMLPAHFEWVDRLPLTPAGKIDRKALEGMACSQTESSEAETGRIDPLEQRMLQIWKGILGGNPLGREENFFDAGGHSLLAVRLLAQIEVELGIRVPLALLIQENTVAGLCSAIHARAHEIRWENLVPIHSGGSRPPLFFVHGMGGGVAGYVDLANSLGEEQPFYGLQASGLDGRTSPKDSIAALAAEYIRVIRQEVQPRGPYQLGGYCLGGLVAYEMACQLARQGDETTLLVLIETYPYHRLHAPWRLLNPAHALRFLKNLPVWLQSEFGRRRRNQARIQRLTLAQKPLRETAAIQQEERIDPLNLVLPGFQAVAEANFRALQTYQPVPYSGTLDLFRVPIMRLSMPYRYDLGWGEYARGGVNVHLLPGEHDTILESPYVKRLAAVLRARLASS